MDLGLEEEACVKGALEVSVNPKGAVCGVMKKGTNDIHPIVVQVRFCLRSLLLV